MCDSSDLLRFFFVVVKNGGIASEGVVGWRCYISGGTLQPKCSVTFVNVQYKLGRDLSLGLFLLNMS